MANLNQVTLVGYLSRDPELRWTPSGTPVVLLGLAVNHRYRQGDEWVDDVCYIDCSVFGHQAEAAAVCYIDCSVFGHQAEAAAAHLSKGSPVLVEGRLRFRTWQTQDGQKRSKHEVHTSNLQFLPRSNSGLRLELDEELDDIPF